MTIDAADFVTQGKPEPEQARVVYASLKHPTCDTLHAELTKRGFKIGRATCARWIKREFTAKKTKRVFTGKNPGPVSSMDRGEVKGIPAPVMEILRADAVLTVMQPDSAMIGGEMTPQEISDIQKDLDELSKLEMPQLKAMQERERLTYNIMMLRQAQRKSDKLVLIPRDSAAFVVAMTDAAESVPTVPMGQLPGDGAKLVEATANPPNPVSDAISQFRKRVGVAA